MRVRPAPDYDVSVAFSDDGLVWVTLQTVDVSVGGLGVLATEELSSRRSGDPIALRVTVTGRDLAIRGTMRHVGASICGIEFGPLDESQTAVIRGAVSELLERGQLA